MDTYRGIHLEYNNLEKEIDFFKSILFSKEYTSEFIQMINTKDIELNERSKNSIKNHKENKNKEEFFLKKLKDKYGTGRLNPFEGKYYTGSTEGNTTIEI